MGLLYVARRATPGLHEIVQPEQQVSQALRLEGSHDYRDLSLSALQALYPLSKKSFQKYCNKTSASVRWEEDVRLVQET